MKTNLMGPVSPERRRFLSLFVKGTIAAAAAAVLPFSLASTSGCRGRSPASTAAVGNISEALAKSRAIIIGYKGADGKVLNDNGTIRTTAKIEGNDAGFFVEFAPEDAIDVNGARSLSLNIKGEIFQRQGWGHYASIQVIDKNGRRFILQELCDEGAFGSCVGKSVTSSSSVRKGTNLKIQLPEGLESIRRLEIVFIGETIVAPGFAISDIGLH